MHTTQGNGKKENLSCYFPSLEFDMQTFLLLHTRINVHLAPKCAQLQDNIKVISLCPYWSSAFASSAM